MPMYIALILFILCSSKWAWLRSCTLSTWTLCPLSLFYIFSGKKMPPHMPIIKQPQMISSYKTSDEAPCETMTILQFETKNTVVRGSADIKTKIEWDEGWFEWVGGWEWVAIGAFELVVGWGAGGPKGGRAGQWLIVHRAGGASADGACSQLSSQHMSQSAEMRPK